jgi:tellurite methyltransferase
VTAEPERLSPDEAIAARTDRAVLDIRDTSEFDAGHWAGSGHVPLDELRARRSELPERRGRLLVVAADGPSAFVGAQSLAELGYETAWLDAPLSALPDGLADRARAVRLWRPAPFLERVLPELPRGRALDLAAGAGREAVWLALHGFEVEAWDHDRDVLARAAAHAAREGVSIATMVRNLERREPELPVASAQLVIVFRFLHRPILPWIERAIAPGGHLVYETYRRGQERFGRPKHPRFLLDDGELARSFPGLEVVLYEEMNPPEGPITARLWARRPA